MARSGFARAVRPRRRGFTLVELLVVIAVVGVVLAIALPSLSHARQAARSAVCLSNVRQLELAHTMYYDDNRGYFVDAGLDHGGVGDASRAWPVVLAASYGASIALRSPGDASPAWPISQGGNDPGLTLAQALDLLTDGDPSNNPPESALARWTSYGLNNYTTRSKQPDPAFMRRARYDAIEHIPSPAATVHFLMMTQGQPRPPGNTISAFAKADHVHVEDWPSAGPGNEPGVASDEMDVAAWGGKPRSFEAMATYGFLDGHAGVQRFRQVYRSFDDNNFDPDLAH